jgi:hypothetical protein
MGNQQVTEARIGWLAGIVDGEGSLLFGGSNKKGHQRYTPILTICNTDPGMILEITKIYESLGVSFYVFHRSQNEDQQHFGKKLMHGINVNRLSSLDVLLPILIPNLITKRDKAVLILQFIKKRLPKNRRENKGLTNQDCLYTEDELALVDAFRNPQRLYAGTSEG